MYHLLPFTFDRYKNYELLVNEIGDYIIAPPGTVERIVKKQVEKDEPLYKDLLSSFFIDEKPIPYLIDNFATRLRTKKAFLGNFTALHIFVLTLRCNQNCIYCQASSKQSHDSIYDMTTETLDNAINLMFQTPSRYITMEFQGGEPSMVFDLLTYAIESTENKNGVFEKDITYVLCTNCVDLSDELLLLCKRYKVLISTSLDGPEKIHNRNRGKENSYIRVLNGIAKARKELGFDRVSALMTASEDSLHHPREIIDSYIDNGFHSIFLRALNPYGLSSSYSEWNDYYDRFIDFYKQSLEYIIELNKNGVHFVEEFTALILKKILTPFSTGFVDLQSPAGIINSVIVYNYDGYLYCSDESRMLAEHDDFTFRLGRVDENYADSFFGKKAQEITLIGINEALAGCSDCVYRVYCGADPVRNYSTQGDIYGIRPTSSFCKKHKQIIEHIFSLLVKREEEVMPIFKRWINNSIG